MELGSIFNKINKNILIFILICFGINAHSFGGVLVKPILLIPKDVGNIDGISEKINDTLSIVRDWYSKQLNGRSFNIIDSGLEVIHIKESIKEFANEKTRRSYSADVCYKLVKRYADVKVDDDKYLWIVFIMNGEFISHGGQGFACLSTDPFYAVRHRKDINMTTGFQSIVAHEMGHAMGLKHPNDHFNDRSLMGRWGGVLFPNTNFLDSDKKILLEGRFISK